MASDLVSRLLAGNVARRFTPFKPPIWDFNYVQSIQTEYHKGEPYASQAMQLKDKVKLMINDDVTDDFVKLEQVDMIQRLGFSYHFDTEIESIMKGFYNNMDSFKEIWKGNLCAIALQFRLLRQYQYDIPQEVFDIFTDEAGSFKPCIVNDVAGLLGLYEASFYMQPGEDVLDRARDFTTKHLREFIENNNKEESYVSILVDHALDVPLHQRVPRFEARWFIDAYRTKPNLNPTFLELAVLDFNLLQSIHLRELKESSRLWKDLGVSQKLGFARDRLVEANLWAIGVTSEQQHGQYRKFITILNSLVTLIDDTYDTYGTLDELENFTNAFESWDINAVESLPTYMKLCFLAVYNHTNQLGYEILKEKGFHIIKYLKTWLADLFRAFFQEAKWCHLKKMPAFPEYIETATISIIIPSAIGFAYCCVANPITEEDLEVLKNYSSIIRQSSLISRLANNLSTSSFESEEGVAQRSIQCYMNETGVSEEEAHRHMKFLISEAWKVMNKDRCDRNSPFSRTFHELIANTARVTAWLYHKRDGFGYETNIMTKDCAKLIFAEPVPFVGARVYGEKN